MQKGYSPLAFRLLTFAHHYRSPIDFSWELLDEYQGHVESIKRLVARLPLPFWERAGVRGVEQVTLADFTAALADDLNTPQAFALFLKTIKQINTLLDTDNTEQAQVRFANLQEMDRVIDVLKPLAAAQKSETIPDSIVSLVQERKEAKKNKDFTRSDALREAIINQGYVVEDTPNGTQIQKAQ